MDCYIDEIQNKAKLILHQLETTAFVVQTVVVWSHNLKDYTLNDPKTQFKYNSMNKETEKLIIQLKSHSNIKDWDVTFAYKVIQKLHPFANQNDDVWVKEDKNRTVVHLEYLLYQIKKERNKVHETLELFITAEIMVQKSEYLKKLLYETLHEAKERFNHQVTQAQLDEAKIEVERRFNLINSALNPLFLVCKTQSRKIIVELLSMYFTSLSVEALLSLETAQENTRRFITDSWNSMLATIEEHGNEATVEVAAYCKNLVNEWSKNEAAIKEMEKLSKAIGIICSDVCEKPTQTLERLLPKFLNLYVDVSKNVTNISPKNLNISKLDQNQMEEVVNRILDCKYEIVNQIKDIECDPVEEICTLGENIGTEAEKVWEEVKEPIGKVEKASGYVVQEVNHVVQKTYSPIVETVQSIINDIPCITIPEIKFPSFRF